MFGAEAARPLQNALVLNPVAQARMRLRTARHLTVSMPTPICFQFRESPFPHGDPMIRFLFRQQRFPSAMLFHFKQQAHLRGGSPAFLAWSISRLYVRSLLHISSGIAIVRGSSWYNRYGACRRGSGRRTMLAIAFTIFGCVHVGAFPRVREGVFC